MEYIGTLGPACCGKEVMARLIDAGMTAARINLSHVMLRNCAPWLDAWRQAAGEAGVEPRLIIDIQGPELRVGTLEEALSLAEGIVCRLGQGGIPVPPIIFPALKKEMQILLDDGALLLEVLEAGESGARCRVLRGGLLRSRKSIAIPEARIQPPALTAADLENLADAAEFGVTAVLQPFVRGHRDIASLRDALGKNSLHHVKIIAKVENREGIALLEELIAHGDEICIARGDLGNDMPLWELPAVQKQIAAACRHAKRPFSVATQMLHSMMESAVPTRAEVCDIFNAVLDGASALILTGETAAGRYPVEAMTYLCKTAENALQYRKSSASHPH